MQVIKIGRNPGNDIIFQDQTVSGTHADIYIHDNGLVQIVDHSSNGTYVDQTYIHGATMDLVGTEMLTFPGQNCVSVSQLLAHFGVQQRVTQQSYQSAPQQPMAQPMAQPQPANVNVNVSLGAKGHHYAEQGLPKCYNRWCWGGFYFGWLWGVFNRVYWPLIVFIPFVGQLAMLIIAFVLGANGNRYAWEKYDGTADNFDQKQRKWNIAALIFFSISMLISIITIIVIVSTAGALLSGF